MSNLVYMPKVIDVDVQLDIGPSQMTMALTRQILAIKGSMLSTIPATPYWELIWFTAVNHIAQAKSVLTSHLSLFHSETHCSGSIKPGCKMQNLAQNINDIFGHKK